MAVETSADGPHAGGCILSDKSAPREQRQEALKWIVHLVGDIHQPLHCAERGKDRGGITRLVMYPGQRQAQNLHKVWDTWLVRDVVGRRHVADVADSLSGAITSSERKEWAQGNPENWANQTHRIAVEAAYRDVPEDGPPLTLNKAYVDRAKAAAVKQIVRAGVRLAMVLNAALR